MLRRKFGIECCSRHLISSHFSHVYVVLNNAYRSHHQVPDVRKLTIPSLKLLILQRCLILSSISPMCSSERFLSPKPTPFPNGFHPLSHPILLLSPARAHTQWSADRHMCQRKLSRQSARWLHCISLIYQPQITATILSSASHFPQRRISPQQRYCPTSPPSKRASLT